MDISTYKALRDCIHYRADRFIDEPGRKELDAPFVLMKNARSGYVGEDREGCDLKERVTESDIVGLLRETVKQEINSYTLEVHVNPHDAELHRRLGILNLLLKNRRAAVEEYKILKDLFPSMADEIMRKWNIKTPF